MVAWHEMPGKRTQTPRPGWDGMIGVAQPNSVTCTLNPMMCFESDRPSDHTVPWGRGVAILILPAFHARLPSLRPSGTGDAPTVITR